MTEQSVGDALTIRELVEKSDLQLEVVAGRSGVDQIIEAVYIGDLDDPTPWMVQGSLLLTTGPRLEGDAQSGARLVRLLKESRMVGIGVAIMPHVREIPAVMLDAADECGLPLLRVPEGTPFRQITSYVFNASLLATCTACGAAWRCRSTSWRPCLPSKRRPDWSRGWVSWSRPTCRCWTARRPRGRRDSARTAQARSRSRGMGRVPESAPCRCPAIGDRRRPRPPIAFREVRTHGRTEQVLMAIYPENSLITDADAALSFAQRLLEVELVDGRERGMVRRRTRAGLLDMLLQRPQQAAELAERLHYHGSSRVSPGACLL